ncbi:MAG TPA: DUF6088 family protein [Bdellovibrio sp.]|nr:DUF6088 family protein [Bdellovibrio sp.]
MKIAATVKSRIDAISDERIITYDDFKDLGEFQAVAMNLSRLQKAGIIKRLSKGRYYKPRITKFGTVAPSDNEILKSVLAKGGYIAGPVAINRLGITTQVPGEILIGGSQSNRKLQLGNLRFKFIKGADNRESYSDSSVINIFEALRLLKKTPDGQIDRTMIRIKSALSELSAEQMKSLINLSLKGRPFIRALLGSLLEDLDIALSFRDILKNSLNPLSIYKLGIPNSLIKSKDAWRIK